MLSASSKIWTRLGVYISYDMNHYTKGTTMCVHVCGCVCGGVGGCNIIVNISFDIWYKLVPMDAFIPTASCAISKICASCKIKPLT